MTAEEVWRPIAQADGYEVSSLGRVRSWRPWPGRTTPRILKQVLHAYGRPTSPYLAVSLQVDRGVQKVFRVHRLVADAFLGPLPEGLETRHLDGNSQNNTAGNLVYGTHSENTLDRVRHGTHNVASRTQCPQGHPYDEENTYLWGPGRLCRACRRERNASRGKASCPACGKSLSVREHRTPHPHDARGLPERMEAMTLHTYDNLEQGSEQWHDARRGLVTASVVGRLVTYGPPDAVAVACPTCEARPENPCMALGRKVPTPIKTTHPARTEHAAGRPPVFEVADNETSRGLTATLIAERVTGWTEDTPMTSDMWRGVLAEPIARNVYSVHYQQAVEVGFMLRDEGMWRLGYSPDGLVGVDGLIEIKAPRAKTHLRTILADEVPAYYMAQLQAGLLVSGRKWIDYVSYVGGMPLYVKRVTPDEQWFEAIVAACIAFETTAAQTIADYDERVTNMPTTERIDLDPEIKVA